MRRRYFVNRQLQQGLAKRLAGSGRNGNKSVAFLHQIVDQITQAEADGPQGLASAFGRSLTPVTVAVGIDCRLDSKEGEGAYARMAGGLMECIHAL